MIDYVLGVDGNRKFGLTPLQGSSEAVETREKSGLRKPVVDDSRLQKINNQG